MQSSLSLWFLCLIFGADLDILKEEASEALDESSHLRNKGWTANLGSTVCDTPVDSFPYTNGGSLRRVLSTFISSSAHHIHWYQAIVTLSETSQDLRLLLIFALISRACY